MPLLRWLPLFAAMPLLLLMVLLLRRHFSPLRQMAVIIFYGRLATLLSLAGHLLAAICRCRATP
jgi:hypothetical protein